MDASARVQLAERIGGAVLDLVEHIVQAVGARSVPPDGGQLLTTREAAEVARRAPETIRAWAKDGRLRDVGGSGRPLYRRADLEEAMARPARRRRPENTAATARRLLRSCS